MKTRNPSFIAGLVLIVLGLFFLVTFFIPGSWPILLIGFGVFSLIVAAFWRVSWPVMNGTIITTLGGILLYQTLTQNWASWYFLWPLVYAAVGMGMLLTRAIDQMPGSLRTVRPNYGGRYLRVSWGFLALGVLFAVVLWFFRAQLNWPSILWGMGALFMLVALFSSISPLAIPGAIFGGLGLLLAYQRITGDWASWAYAWALLPAFVAVGLLLAFLGRRTLRVVALSMLSWSLVVFVIFGIFFAGNGALIRFWPVTLILAGLIVLIQGLLVRRRDVPRAG